jgi:hypothetical protein
VRKECKSRSGTSKGINTGTVDELDLEHMKMILLFVGRKSSIPRLEEAKFLQMRRDVGCVSGKVLAESTDQKWFYAAFG